MKKFAALRLPACVLAATVAMNGCANMDQKTQSAGVGAAVGCAAGAVLAKLTKNDATTACVAGAVVGGLIGDAVEEGVTSQKGLQYTVRLDRGGDIVVTQGADPMIPRNARVQVIYDRDGTVRIVQVR